MEALIAAGRDAEAAEYDETPEEIERLHRDPGWPSLVNAIRSFPREVRAFHDFWRLHPVDGGRWAGLRIPALLLYGDENPTYAATGELLARGLNDARLAVLSGQGHQAYRTAPSLLAGAILPFVR
jgi:pimeloyl-ACP methyl ester carboxylesterase